LQSFVAGRAVLAAADHAADADHIAGLEAGHLAADGADAADDLVPRHAAIQRAAPLRARGVQVGMADAAIRDLDLHVLRAGRAAGDIHRLEGLVGGGDAVGACGHGAISVRMRTGYARDIDRTVMRKPTNGPAG